MQMTGRHSHCLPSLSLMEAVQEYPAFALRFGATGRYDWFVPRH